MKFTNDANYSVMGAVGPLGPTKRDDSHVVYSSNHPKAQEQAAAQKLASVKDSSESHKDETAPRRPTAPAMWSVEGPKPLEEPQHRGLKGVFQRIKRA